MSTVVLVHGGWSGGWCWDKVVPLLEEAGHQVEAPNLPGHGDDRTPIPEVSLRSNADRISQGLDVSRNPSRSCLSGTALAALSSARLPSNVPTG